MASSQQQQARGQRAGGQAYQTVVAGQGLGRQTRTYHRIVLAEFMVCVVLVGMSPVLTPRKSGTQADETAAAFSLAGPVVRLTAVSVVFFVLALMATGPRAGKVAAAFGALVVLGVLLNATDELAVLAKALTVKRTGGGGQGAIEGSGGPVNP
jgi:hypothetical protein